MGTHPRQSGWPSLPIPPEPWSHQPLRRPWVGYVPFTWLPMVAAAIAGHIVVGRAIIEQGKIPVTPDSKAPVRTHAQE